MITFLEAALQEKSWLDTELLEAYSKYYNKEKSWLYSDHAGKTIQDLINDACDVLEESGHDLSKTSTAVVLETIDNTVVVEFRVPEGYKQLEETLTYLKELLLESKESGYSSAEFEASILQTIDKVEKQIKKMLL